MTVCSRQLSTLLKGETPYQTPAHAKMCSQPIMPLEPENEKDFVRLYIYVHVYMYVTMYVCMYLCMYKYVLYVCMYVYTHVCM